MEMKAGSNRLTTDQESFGRLISENGGIFIEVRDPEDVVQALKLKVSLQ
jgi:glutamine cyclotransferase